MTRFKENDSRSLMAVVAVMAAFTSAGIARAAPAAQARASTLQAVADCRKIADGAERLACFDQAAARLDTAEQSGDVIVVDRAQVREARRAAFGFNVSLPAFMTRGEAPEELDSVTGVVGSARQTPDGKWVIKLADGAVWRQIDSDPVTRAPRQGSPVEIRKGALGSYFLKVDGQHSIRVHRDN